MHRRRNGIRGPTVRDKTNDRAGNAAVRQRDREGSGTDQPGRQSGYLMLAPALSVGGAGGFVKAGGRSAARILADERARSRRFMRPMRIIFAHAYPDQTGMAGKHAGLAWRSIAIPRGESGTTGNE